MTNEENINLLNTDFEKIQPWNGEHDSGYDVRLKWERNFARIKANYPALLKIFEGYLSDLDKKYLRKDISDETDFLLRIGEFIDSMVAGKGTGIFPDGRIQTDRLEVRGSMTVMDLIINELHAMAGEYNFSDCGKIDKVELVKVDTYKLWMHKDVDTDVTTLDTNDVLYSIVNNIKLGGKDYYTSWFRVITKNTADNTITVVLYPDKEIPGKKNYPPLAGYNVTRRGNVVLPEKGQTNERAQSWMISSREGRMMFLQNVYKPILEDWNYSLSLGKFPDIDIVNRLDLNNDVGLYAQTIVCEKLYRVDWNGDVVCEKVDRGEWSLDVAQSDKPYRYAHIEKDYPDGKKYTLVEQHTVYHYGCKWGCLIDMTTDEPKWNAEGWVLLEGDKNYHLDFESSNGWQFFLNNIDTIVTAVVSYANRDITEWLFNTTGVQSEWIRDSGNSSADNSWSPKIVNNRPNIIHLSRDDMGSGWGFEYRKISFTFRVFIPVGKKYEKIEQVINIKI